MRLLAGLFLLATFSVAQIFSKPAQSTSGTPGIKMTVRYEGEKHVSEQTLYIQGDRERMEYQPASNATHGDGTLDTRPGPHLVDIGRCDLGQEFELNLEDREYVVRSYPPYKLTKQQIEARMQARTHNTFQKVAPWIPTVRVETKTLDTGERKNFFGYEARHLISTHKTIPMAESHSGTEETVTDAWYIDLDTTIPCESRWQPHNVSPRHEYYAVGGERYEVIDDGIQETGFAIERKYTSRSTVALPDGTKKENVFSNEEKITEFHEGALDAALFEVPGDFRKVSQLRREPPLTLADRWYLVRGWVKGMAKNVF
jgi:hypothetical protein